VNNGNDWSRDRSGYADEGTLTRLASQVSLMPQADVVSLVGPEKGNYPAHP
jgi:hypothetical protein